MISRYLTRLALAAGCVAAAGAPSTTHAQSYQQQAYNVAAPRLVTNGPQTSAGDRNGWLARQDIVASRRYDRLLETNLAFRRYREHKECDPITLPPIRAQCFASFRQYEPFMRVSSYAPHRHRRAGS